MNVRKKPESVIKNASFDRHLSSHNRQMKSRTAKEAISGRDKTHDLSLPVTWTSGHCKFTQQCVWKNPKHPELAVTCIRWMQDKRIDTQ